MEMNRRDDHNTTCLDVLQLLAKVKQNIVAGSNPYEKADIIGAKFSRRRSVTHKHRSQNAGQLWNERLRMGVASLN